MENLKQNVCNNSRITKTHFGVYGIVRRGSKILLIKKTLGPYTGMLDLPGGSPEKDETSEQTLVREIKEETGCTVVAVQNERHKTIIFGDFTKESGEQGVLQHSAVLYDTEIEGTPNLSGDGRDSGGCVWVDADDLTAQNATPYALIGAGKPLIALADENDNIITTHIRGTPLPQSRFVMVSAILLFNARGDLIMQKIALHKDWGGLWTYSAAGHVDAGENYEQAAVRELKEEMGIDALIEKEVAVVPLFSNGRLMARHHVFLAHSDAPIISDPFEVAEIKEISPQDLKEQIKINPEAFFEPFVRAFEAYCAQIKK